MDLLEIKKIAKIKMKGVCNLCRECDGVWCRGMVPGMGGVGNGSTMQRNYNKLNDVKLIMKTLHSAKNPDISFSFLGKILSVPMIIAPISGLNYNAGGGVTEKDYIDDVIKGSVETGTIAMIGDGGNPDFYKFGIDGIKKANGHGIAIIKPRENSEIIKRIRMAENANALAVGVDIDGAGLLVMRSMGQAVGPKTLKEIKELVNSTKLPFILKGILSVDEAKIAQEAGVDAIIVSNHGGRVLNSTISSIEVVFDIVRAVGDKMIVLADGGVREGIDVLKFLATGAHGVLLGRPVIWGSIGGGKNGVKMIIEKLKKGLYQGMILTGASTIKDINNSMLLRSYLNISKNRR